VTVPKRRKGPRRHARPAPGPNRGRVKGRVAPRGRSGRGGAIRGNAGEYIPPDRVEWWAAEDSRTGQTFAIVLARNIVDATRQAQLARPMATVHVRRATRHEVEQLPREWGV